MKNLATSGTYNLYAKWTANTYKISYNLNGGSMSGQKTSYTIETNNFTLPKPTRSGYTFSGWTGSNGTTAQTSVTISKGSTGDRTYTANWKQNVVIATATATQGNGVLDAPDTAGHPFTLRAVPNKTTANINDTVTYTITASADSYAMSVTEYLICKFTVTTGSTSYNVELPRYYFTATDKRSPSATIGTVNVTVKGNTSISFYYLY